MPTPTEAGVVMPLAATAATAGPDSAVLLNRMDVPSMALDEACNTERSRNLGTTPQVAHRLKTMDERGERR